MSTNKKLRQRKIEADIGALKYALSQLPKRKLKKAFNNNASLRRIALVHLMTMQERRLNALHFEVVGETDYAPAV